MEQNNMYYNLTMPFEPSKIKELSDFQKSLGNTLSIFMHDYTIQLSELQKSLNYLAISINKSFNYNYYNKVFVELGHSIAKVMQQLNYEQQTNDYVQMLSNYGRQAVEQIKDNFTEEEIRVINTEVDVAITEAVAQKENWQQTLKKKIDQYEKTNPIIAWLLAQIIIYLLTIFMQSAASVIKDSFVRTEPSSSAQSIQKLTANYQVTVIGQVPYYYEITFLDSSGESYTGFISKKNIRINESYIGD